MKKIKYILVAVLTFISLTLSASAVDTTKEDPLRTCRYDKTYFLYYYGRSYSEVVTIDGVRINVSLNNPAAIADGCPSKLYLEKGENGNLIIHDTYSNGYTELSLTDGIKAEEDNKDKDNDVIFKSDMPNFCTKTSAIWQFVGYALYALKILVPLLIMILGVIDFTKATVMGDDKAIPKAAITLIQRIIWGVLIFLVPTIVNILVGLITEAADVKAQSEGCYSCLLDPTGGDCKTQKEVAKSKR